MNKTYILAMAKLTDIEQELCPTEAIELANASDTRGKVPVIPILENQKDLTKLVAILLSNGINRNDDVFLAKEILPVRNTGAHKPVNLEHDPKKIIGHMIRTFATEKGGKRILDGKNPKGKFFDITAEAVIYKFLFPDLARDIADRADSNELFVSVEVWFTAFDFLVGSELVKRTAATASMLESRLKVNGGTGNFEGKKLGRVLRNLIIGGIGVVKDPANPESIIKSVSSFDSEVVQDIEDETIASEILCDFNILEDQSKTTELIEIDQVTTEEVDMNPEIIEEMAALAAAIKASADENNTEEVTEVEVGDNPKLQALASRLGALEKDNRELKTRADEAEYKAEAARRESALRKAGLPNDQIEPQLTRCFNMNKDQFNEYVGLLVNAVNSILRSTASATAVVENTETTEVAEGGEAGTSEVEASTETTEVEVAETVETETQEVVEKTAEVESTEPAETETTEIEEINVEIEAVDPEINIEGGQEEQVSLTDQFGDVVQKFLKHHNDRWEKLAIK